MGLMIASAVLMAIGLVLIIIGVVFIIPQKRLSSLQGKAVGIIKDMVKDAYSFNLLSVKKLESQYGIKRNTPVEEIGVREHDSAAYYQVYEYEVNGILYQRASGVGYGKSQVKKTIGKKVDVFYDVSDPFESSLSNGAVYKYLTIGLCSLGIILSLIGMVVLIISIVVL